MQWLCLTIFTARRHLGCFSGSGRLRNNCRQLASRILFVVSAQCRMRRHHQRAKSVHCKCSGGCNNALGYFAVEPVGCPAHECRSLSTDAETALRSNINKKFSAVRLTYRCQARDDNARHQFACVSSLTRFSPADSSSTFAPSLRYCSQWPKHIACFVTLMRQQRHRIQPASALLAQCQHLHKQSATPATH